MTDSAQSARHRPERPVERFGVDTAVHAWASDITCVATGEGGVYLAVIIALQTRQVLGYSLSDRMPDELVLNALRNACHLQTPPGVTLFHSGREDLRGVRNWAILTFAWALGGREQWNRKPG